MIPDYGESDVLHLNLPIKHIMSTSLKNNKWPLWNQYLANGYPILAESQIGTFYLPNLLLFRFLPTVIAYNLNLLISFTLASIGMYAFMRTMNFSYLASIFASMVFTFSGFFSTHLNHFNLLQTASLLPLVFYASYFLWKKSSIKYIIFFSLILSQQMLSGYIYLTFITLIGIGTFWIGLFFTQSKYSLEKLSRKTIAITASLTIALFLSAIQIMPTYELFQYSQRKEGLNFQTVTSFPYSLKHLITFLSPYALGNPADGTYPQSFNSETGIFWENTAYVGIVPLGLALVSIFFIRKSIVKIGFLLLTLSILLVLGKNSPLYFIFSFPPFNSFRVPSRYIVLTVFALSLLCGFMFDKIANFIVSSKKLIFNKTLKKTTFFFLTTLIFVATILDEYRFSYNYPPVSPASWWTDIPETAKFIKEKEGKIASLGVETFWNSLFLNKGWQDMKPYVYFRNNLYPNYNALFSIKQIDINTGGLKLNRYSFLSDYVMDNFYIDEKRKTVSLSAITDNALSLAGVEYIITPYKIQDSSYKEVKIVNPPDDLDLNPFYVYENLKALPISYISYKTTEVSTVEDILRLLQKADFLEDETILVEDFSFPEDNKNNSQGTVLLHAFKDDEIILESKSENEGILVLSATNYPGWTALVDGKPTEIIQTNLFQMGIVIPKGNHIVRFFYYPKSFHIGKRVTVVSFFITALVVFLFPYASFDKFLDKILSFLHLYNRRKR